MNRLKQHWGIDSNFQLFIILVVFALTGSSADKLASPVCDLIGVDTNTAWYIYWPIRILLIFPIYQILLVLFGWIFGQFKFFWDFEKKMLSRIGLSRFLN